MQLKVLKRIPTTKIMWPVFNKKKLLGTCNVVQLMDRTALFGLMVRAVPLFSGAVHMSCLSRELSNTGDPWADDGDTGWKQCRSEI